MIIVLLGYMGSGKSSVGRELANTLSYKFLDLDDVIEEGEGKSIPEIFSTQGEIYFRKKETQYLNQILEKEEHCVLSLGGGTPCYSNNMSTIGVADSTISFYLDLSISKLANRLVDEKDHRPVISHLQTIEELQEYIAKHLFERRPFYELANHKISVKEQTIKQLVEEILLKLF